MKKVRHVGKDADTPKIIQIHAKSRSYPTKVGFLAGQVAIHTGWHNTISGRDGNDTIDGGIGDDEITGGRGGDFICGGPGDDALFGSTGDDTLEGGAGSNVLSGGQGSDRFVFGTGTASMRSAISIPLLAVTGSILSASPESAVLPACKPIICARPGIW